MVLKYNFLLCRQCFMTVHKFESIVQKLIIFYFGKRQAEHFKSQK